MTTNRPIAIRPALDRPLLPGPDPTDAPRGQRNQERAAALWLYAWSYDALRPTGELLAARLMNPAVLRPCRKAIRISPRTRRRQASP